MTRVADRRERLLWWGVLGGALLVLSAGVGLRDPWPPDEPRFALMAREMVESGQWLVPHVAGVPYPDKPPVFLWSVAGLYALTGSLRVAVLLPAIAGALLTLWLTGDLARRLWEPATGAVAAAALALTLQFIVQGRSGQIDGFLLGLTTASLYGLFRHLLLGPSWLWWRLAWVAAGLGVLTKGVGFLPLLVLLPWAALPRAPMAGSWRQWWSGPALFVAVLAAWAVPMLAATSGGDPALAAYRDEILLRQTVVRYARTWTHVRHPLYFPLQVIPFLWLPLAVLIPWLVPRWRQAWRHRDPRILLPLAWALLVVLFFSLSPGKRGLYILPALPAVVWAAAPWLRELSARAGVQRMLRLLLTAAGLAGAAATIGSRIIPPDRVSVLMQGTDAVLLPWIPAATVVLGVGAVFAGRGRAVAAWACTTLVLALVWGWGVMPALNDARSAAPFMARADALVPPAGSLGLVDWKEQFVLHAVRPVTHFGYRRLDRREELADARTWAAGDRNRRLLVAADHPGFALAPGHRAETLGLRHRKEWWVVSAADLLPPISDPGAWTAAPGATPGSGR